MYTSPMLLVKKYQKYDWLLYLVFARSKTLWSVIGVQLVGHRTKVNIIIMSLEEFRQRLISKNMLYMLFFSNNTLR